MAVVGYARVSTTGQSLDVQLEQLARAGCEKVFSEKRSGLDGKRPELANCLDYVRDGDTLLVTKLDRLARSTTDLYRTIETLKSKGVGFRVVDDPTIDTTSRTGKLIMGILALIAEFETDIRKERQMDGIAKAKADKKQFGPPRKIEDAGKAEIRRKRAEGVLIKDLMAEYKLSKAHVYRILSGTPA
ncbi:MAG: recombinase family protein [Parvibaculum sp.]|uniref:recombinase family protein n=1 Tax=Parvibaculum sp. TaxID=2024848 RepID=UPI00284F7232|nr:recombinase family protein [Parvibaculum sp.]MDR3500912.1 recombinase family protein [Parvibaculum sp.]